MLQFLGCSLSASLVQRWVSITFTPVVSTVTQSKGAYIDWNSLPSGVDGIKSALEQFASLGSNGLNVDKVTTLQQNLDQLIPGLSALLLTLLCMLAIEEESITNRYYRCFIHYRNSCTSWWNNVI